MNRLTEWTGERWIARQEKLNGKTIGDKDIYAKLAAYENTGLEPEQIRSFLKDFGISAVMSNTKLRNELKEYKDLEEQGLLIKLPCKVGDTVYAINCNEIIESTVTEITLNEKGVRYIRLYSTDDRLADFKYDYFKKTVSLTREEAEKALEENKNE